MKSASALKPCLCSQISKEEAHTDVYIQNQTRFPFYLSSYNTTVNVGRGFVESPGVWVIKPPECIRPGKTIFFRAYSGKFSAEDDQECFFPIQFLVQAEYISLDQPGQLQATLVKVRDGAGSCRELEEFGSVEQRNTFNGEINIYQNNPSEPKWSNTAFIIITGETNCKVH